MKKYYTHIEALRGMAILLVMLYHLMPQYCPKGYIGVDIFLMISGYFLISRLLRNDEKKFNIIEFTNQKILRIYSPLILMVLFMSIVSLWVMAESELHLATKTAFYSLCAYSNVFLDAETQGYFANDVGRNPFVHTWFLSVILQVYFLFSVVTWLLRRFSSKIKWMAYIAIGLVSLSVVAYYRFIIPLIHPHEIMIPMYYWTWGRIYEVVAGACLLLIPTIRPCFFSNLLTPVGMLILFYCCFSVEKHPELIVLAGAMLIKGNSENWSSKILDNKFFRFFGKYSFSLYLWHWPIIVYSRYAIENTSMAIAFILFGGSILVGMLAWSLAEKKRCPLWILLPIWGGGVCVEYYLMTDDTLSRKIHPHIYEASEQEIRHVRSELCPDYPDYGYKTWIATKYFTDGISKGKILLKLGKNAQKATFLMMGDSHAFSFMPGMAEIAARLNISGYYLPMYVTPFHNRMCSSKRLQFDADNAKALTEWLMKHQEIQQIVLIQRWSIRFSHKMNNESMPLHYDGSTINSKHLYEDTEKALADFCEKLKKLGKNVIIVTEVPAVPINPSSYLRRALIFNHTIDTRKITCTVSDYYRMQEPFLNTFAKLENMGLCEILPIHQALLKSGAFSAYANGKILMKDDDHISSSGGVLYAQEHYRDWERLLCPRDENAR